MLFNTLYYFIEVFFCNIFIIRKCQKITIFITIKFCNICKKLDSKLILKNTNSFVQSIKINL